METNSLTTPPAYVESMGVWGWFFAVLFALLAAFVLVTSLFAHRFTRSAPWPLGCSTAGALIGTCSLFTMFRAVPSLSNDVRGWVIVVSFFALVTVVAVLAARWMGDFSGILYPIGGAILAIVFAAMLDKLFESLALIPISIAGFAAIVFIIFALANDRS